MLDAELGNGALDRLLHEHDRCEHTKDIAAEARELGNILGCACNHGVTLLTLLMCRRQGHCALLSKRLK